MLRITDVVDTPTDGRVTWTLKVEGILIGEWLPELRRAWRRAQDAAAVVGHVDAGEAGGGGLARARAEGVLVAVVVLDEERAAGGYDRVLGRAGALGEDRDRADHARGAGAQPGGGAAKDDVVDAEFTEVDDDKNNKKST